MSLETPTQEAAAQPSTSNPADTIDISETTGTGEAEDISTDTPSGDQPVSSTMDTTLQVTEETSLQGSLADVTTLLSELAENYQAAIVNPIFTENPKRIQRAIESLKVPVADDRAYQQYYNHARKDLIEKAFKEAIKNNCAPAMPAEDAIHTLAKKRHDDAAEKAKQKADKKK